MTTEIEKFLERRMKQARDKATGTADVDLETVKRMAARARLKAEGAAGGKPDPDTGEKSKSIIPPELRIR
jgi:hypothetical protein